MPSYELPDFYLPHPPRLNPHLETARAHTRAWAADMGMLDDPDIWDAPRLETYRIAHGLPAHPLVAKGYRSIGCASCTRPTAAGEDARAGRWAGIDKAECGIHLPEPHGDNI